MKIRDAKKSGGAPRESSSGKRGGFATLLKENGEKRKEKDRDFSLAQHENDFATQSVLLPGAIQHPELTGTPVRTQSADMLSAALAYEIAVQAPHAGDTSVSIQFDSKILSGLHVRIERSDNGLQVMFSTNSAAVSEVLTANFASLESALEKRGYVSPRLAMKAAGTGYTPASAGSDGSRNSRDSQGRSRK